MMGPLTSITDAGASFLVDSVVLLRFVEIESRVRKALTVVEMRGSNHDRGLREFEVGHESSFRMVRIGLLSRNRVSSKLILVRPPGLLLRESLGHRRDLSLNLSKQRDRIVPYGKGAIG